MGGLAFKTFVLLTWHFCQTKAGVYKQTHTHWYTVFSKLVIFLIVIFSMQSLADNLPMHGEASWQPNTLSMLVIVGRWEMALLSECGETNGSHNHLLFALSPCQI